MTMRRLALWLTILFVFTIPWEDSLAVPGIGSIARLVGAAAACAWILSMFNQHGTVPRPLQRFHGLLFVYVMWTGFTIYWSYLPAKSVVGFVTNVQLLLLAVMLWDLIDGAALTLAALQAYVLGAHVVVGLTFFEFLQGTTTRYLRFGAPGADLDSSALIMAIGVPAALFLGTSRVPAGSVSLLLRIANYAYAPVAAFGILLTATRGAVLASIPTVVYAVTTFARGPGRRKAAILAVAGLAIVAAMRAPAASLERITSIGGELESSGGLNGRVDIWRESLDAFLHRPLIGVGNDAHRAAVLVHKVAHNTPLSILTETGLIGLAVFCLVMAEVVRSIRRNRGAVGRYWRVQMLVIALGSLSLSTEDRKAVWLFILLAVGGSAFVGEQNAAEVQSSHERIARSASAATRREAEHDAMDLGRDPRPGGRESEP